jgi:hypothetical protein
MAKRTSEANAAVGAALGRPLEPAAPEPPRKEALPKGARSMLYIPSEAKRKIQEIAFAARRKENDIYLDAIREYLERQGYSGLL